MPKRSAMSVVLAPRVFFLPSGLHVVFLRLCHATAGYNSRSTAGYNSRSTAGYNSRSTAGYNSRSTAG
ncbi:MAG: hypothetical protein ACTSXZ_05760, partial [Alphaproteobacteria bacterium]